MVYDDARMRHMRITRLVQGYSMSAVAAARTARTISRFTVEGLTDGNGHAAFRAGTGGLQT